LATNAKAFLSGTRRRLSSVVPCISSLRGHLAAIIQERPRLRLGLLTALTGAVGAAWLATRVPATRRCDVVYVAAGSSSGQR
jgi:hypothetical protein